MNRAFENFSAIDGRLAVFVAPLCAFGAYGSLARLSALPIRRAWAAPVPVGIRRRFFYC